MWTPYRMSSRREGLAVIEPEAFSREAGKTTQDAIGPAAGMPTSCNPLKSGLTSDKGQYVNHSPDSNSFLFNHLIKTEADARPARGRQPQHVVVGR